MQISLSYFQDILRRKSEISRIYNLTGSSSALLLAMCDEPFFAVDGDESLAAELCEDINFYRSALKKNKVFYLPEPDGPEISGKRAEIILTINDNDSLTSSSINFNSSIWSKKELEERILFIKKGLEIRREEIENILQKLGYTSVPLVSEKGEFSRRGWIMDIFPTTFEDPIRIEFFGDEIENIKYFDVNTQRSKDSISELYFYPAIESSNGKSLLETFSDKIWFVFDSIKEKENMPEGSIILSRFSIAGDGIDSGVLNIKGLGITYQERKSIDELPCKLKNLMDDNRIILVSSSSGQAERLRDILRAGDIIAPLINKEEIFSYKGNIIAVIGGLSSGLYLPGLLILTEKELFGERPAYRPLRKSKVSGLLTSLDDLRPGDFIVHTEHGIGKFIGLIQQITEGIKEDLILIEYDGGRLYVPLHAINKIRKYHAEEGVIPRIDKLGGKSWIKTRERVKRKIHEMAEKLLALYAQRKIQKGHSFSANTELHREFDSFFPYEETPDQLNAVEDIKKDMESDKPMDRLICGDVGYGKTEVAVRAAFKAVYDGMQVAVLVPTTILCEQHYRTFKTRFSGFPVNIDFLSRFKSTSDKKKTIKAINNGDIDIVIGTHALLGKNIKFYNLGLLIIDEEHRFGVSQKEKIKELKKGIDVLTLTATPIPRTLSMALSDIRDMSIIETPPEERLAVKSIVSVFNENIIKNAITHELDRKGQVFFVHNRIKDIYRIADYLVNLIPEIKIAVAHGQMNEKDLEKVMFNFYEKKVDVLVSTAIIGSGLDIPSANTIIINRADTMGLADLYQLRGRVGRGNLRAYAYFLIPGEDIITIEAKKRLQAIQEMSYLGAGFRLALKDLEIRGSGNLLGAEQSGHIHAVGLDLYMEMLEKAVAELKGVKIEEEFEPSINMKVNAFIPENYVEDITIRLSLYRKIAASKSPDALYSIASEIEDRFGKIPFEVRCLLDIMKLKILSRELLIKKINESKGIISIHFSNNTKVQPEDIFMLKEKVDKRLKFLPDGFEIATDGSSWEEKYNIISELFRCLSDSVNVESCPE
ncbi:MAG: transcription-repair coupling factor [Nitrospirae bacterium]|jgi:transcription-repair coupling factor (superfamily II helicase)|nr:transcription-repair coupling factor [Nitrospirota bacterium]